MCSQHKYYSSVFSLVFLFNIQYLTSLPLESPHIPYAPQTLLSLNVSDVPIPNRSINVSDNTPSLRTGFESPLSANISTRSALPTVNVNPVPLANPVLPDISLRSGLSPEVPPPLGMPPPVGVPVQVVNPQPVERASFGVNESTVNVSGVVPNNESPLLRNGLVGVTSNSSVIEQRALHVPNSPPVNASEVSIELRSGLNPDSSPVGVANSSVSNYGSPGGSFVPSFFKSFGLREKRGEISEGSAPVVDISLRSGLEQPAREDDSLIPDLAAKSNAEQAASLNDNTDVAASPQLASSVEGASKDANLYSGSNVKSPVHPYVNVFPIGSFGY
ncbi:hypothetical protein ILUMI_01296 [Ignelater luminosus]|uniref:Uncharacterized protein n=1 Tax=Ignelater luminosus TaxID=2038154 RepID=A0A8K0DIS6_IGNLU|nr:hypothetical protein ILUMI_01296 [Ignelater luminosus]